MPCARNRSTFPLAIRGAAYAVAAATFLTLTLSGCGKDGGPLGPGDTGDDLPGILDPDPNGVLLEGDEGAPAREVLVNLAPSAVDAAEVVEGLLTTRLTAAIAPGATVAAVNAALEASDARIVSMSSASPFVTLRIPAVPDADAARAIGEALVATGAFLYAAPAHAVEQVETPGGALAARAADETPLPAHLLRMRVPAAWNAAELALANGDRITVVVPDVYASVLPHADIDAQSFVGYGAPNPLPGPEVYPGNNGFVVSGIVGANPDEVGATGVSPAPATLLDVDSMALGGLTWFDIFNSLSWTLASSGSRFVLNTGIGYLDPDFVTFPPVDRAMHVLAWRVAAATHYHQFVHIVAAGSAEAFARTVGGGADASLLRSPFLAAAHFDDVREMVDMTAVGTADSVALETAWQDMVDTFPLATAIANNVLVVGSADAIGALARPVVAADYVEAPGADVLGPCVSQDPAFSPGFLCDGEVAVYSGTGVAAAQVSGLAAYLMNLSGALPAEIRASLLHAYQSSSTGLVDAYNAILSLDGSANGAVRRALLDVAGFESEESDGDFDDFDLEVWMPTVSESNPPGGGGGGGVSLRHDLNGDGLVGGLGTYRFDLNADRAYGTVTQSIDGADVSFDENAVTDFEILCYYAYSSLYNGDLDRRQQLLAASHGGPFLEFLNLPETIEPDVPTPVTVRAGVENEGVITYLEGVRVYFSAHDGEVDVHDTLTDADGRASANLTLDPDRNEVTLDVDARIGDDNVEVQTSLVRPNSVQFLSGSYGLLVEVAYGHSTQQTPYQWIFDNWQQISGDLDGSPVDTSTTRSGGVTSGGMTASGTATATQQSSVDLYEGDHFAGCSVDATIDGNMSLSSSNPAIPHYQAQCDASSELDVDFVVWGTEAQFSLHGTVSAKYYDIELYGPQGTLFLCDSGDDPCFTISAAGPLPQGEYRLSVDIGDDVFFGEICAEEPSCDTFGSETMQGTVSINLEVPFPQRSTR